MSEQQWLECRFKGNTVGYTYLNETGETFAAGDVVVVDTKKGGETKVEVVSVLDGKPEVPDGTVFRNVLRRFVAEETAA